MGIGGKVRDAEMQQGAKDLPKWGREGDGNGMRGAWPPWGTMPRAEMRLLPSAKAVPLTPPSPLHPWASTTSFSRMVSRWDVSWQYPKSKIPG